MIFENYYLYRAAIWLISRLPLGFVYFAAGVIAELNYYFNLRSRRGIMANQAHILPPGTPWWTRFRSGRAAFRNFSYSLVDFFRIPSMTPANAERFFAEVKGWEHIQAALATGKGGIFITVHMGSWEMAGAYLGFRGVPITAAALPHKDPRIDQIFLNNREGSGMEVVPVGGALAKLEQAVERGRIIGLVSDRDTSGKGPILPFLGQPTHMPDGHARLALRTGAWILPGYVYRLRDMRPVIEIRPPIVPDPREDTVESLTLACLSDLEDFIRRHPEQWFSFYDLWDGQLPVA